MPEDTNPGFAPGENELRLAYFTLPMALNYQRDSYKLWQSALNTYNDPDTRNVFRITEAANMPTEILQAKLVKHRLALQPFRHVATWQTISKTVSTEWQDLTTLISSCHYDFLKLQEEIQHTHKHGFPYLSGPKIFHYWCFILQEYGRVTLVNSDWIEVAVDTHVLKCSIRLGVIAADEADRLTREQVSQRWREALEGSGIRPNDMHTALWFWSRNNFVYDPLAN